MCIDEGTNDDAPLFSLEGRAIFHRAISKVGDNGAKTLTLGFKVCEIDEWVDHPESVLTLLNAGHTALLEKEKRENATTNVNSD